MSTKRKILNQIEAIYKITSPKGDSKSVSLGLCPGSKNAKRSQFYPQFFKYTYPHNAAFAIIYPPKADFYPEISQKMRTFPNFSSKTNPISPIERRETSDEINMQNEPNSHTQTNVTPAISEDYEHAQSSSLSIKGRKEYAPSNANKAILKNAIKSFNRTIFHSLN
jgi:hypothetical protein